MNWCTFNTKDHYYIYDRQENRIGELSKDDYNAIVNNPEDTLVLRKLQKNGFCRENMLETIENPASEYIDYYLHNQMTQLVLQVTQQCNLRCSYCVYSGSYNNRTHTNKNMTFETAKKAVDFLISNSKDSKKVYVGFYGGEPLLRFDLIKEVINYIEREYPGKRVGYSMTTNSTLLSEEIGDYIATKNFNLVISLDGPESIQNKNRCFANGKGSYSTVIRNLKALKERHPEYYARCSLGMTLSQDTDFSCINSFVKSEDIIDSISARVGFISDVGLDKLEPYDEKVYAVQEELKMKQLLSFMGEITEKLEFHLFGSYSTTIVPRQYVLDTGIMTIKKGHPGGPCLAGVKKAFVDVDGNIYPCEKIAESEELKIGNINEGFYNDKVLSLINIAKTTENECKNCWAFAFCTSCVAASINRTGISSEKRLKKCKGIKLGIILSLRELKIMEEYGYDAKRFFSAEVPNE